MDAPGGPAYNPPVREEILRRFRRLRRRHLWVRGWDLFLEAAFATTMTAGVLLLADRLMFELGAAPPRLSSPAGVVAATAGALLLAAAYAGAVLRLRPVSAAWVAWRLDRATGGEERFLSAVEIAASGDEGPFARAVLHDAVRLAERADPAKILPAAPVGYRGGIALSLAASAVLLAWPPRLYDAPEADFEASPLRGPAPLEVAFRDTSIGAIDTFRWDFGDGGKADGEEVVHVYETPGRYAVRLSLRGPGGASEKTGLIEVLPPDRPAADFEAEPLKGRAPLEVRFRNLSRNALRHRWEFGDGEGSEEAEPVHTYRQPGFYGVRLEVSNEIGRDARVRGRYIRVLPEDAPLADFRALPREGEAPLRVNFEDHCRGTVRERRWDFGDPRSGADNASAARHPYHVYRVPGHYTVKLLVRGPHGEDEEEKIRYIHVKAPGSGGGGGGGMATHEPPQPRPERTPGGAGGKPGRDFGEKPDRPRVNLVPEGVPPHTSGGELTEKIKVMGRAGGGGRGTLEEFDYGKIYPEYRKMAEDSINRELIPPAYRETLRLYYNRIYPKPE